MTAVFCFLSDFGKFSVITFWTRRKGIRIIIKSDKLPTSIAPIRSFAGLFSCCRHIISPILKDGFRISLLGVKSTATTNVDAFTKNLI